MGFEEGTQAMEQSLTTRDQAPPESEKPELQGSGVEISSQSEAPEITDLGSLEKFLYEGKEWTPQDLKKAIMMQSDYTRKTQAIAKEKEFTEALKWDLPKVLKNPSLIIEFKKIYPESYHAWIDEVVGDLVSDQPEQREEEVQAPSDNIVMKRIQRLETTLNNYERKSFDSEVKVKTAEINSLFDKMSKKYSYAKEKEVISDAQLLLEQKGEGEELTEDDWNSLWKSSHDDSLKRFGQYQKGLVDQQKQASSRARDVPAGGGVVGNAPQKLNFKQATEAAIKHFSGS